MSRSNLLQRDVVTLTCTICGEDGATPAFQKLGYEYYSCSGCGTHRIYPQPSEDFIRNVYSAEYFDGENPLSDPRISRYANYLGEAQPKRKNAIWHSVCWRDMEYRAGNF